MSKLLNRRMVAVAVAVLLVIVLVISYGVSHKDSTPGDSPLALAPPLTPSQLAKIDPELLAVIEKGRKATPDNFIFDSEGWINCIVYFDPGKVVVTPTTSRGLPVGEQPAGRLIIRHGGRVQSERGLDNAASCFIPLNKIKGLAQEEAVIEIFPNRVIPAGNE